MGYKRNKLGEILLDTTDLTPENLEEALAIQSEKGERIGEILIDMGYINRDDLYKALSLQFDIPYSPELPEIDIDVEIIRQVPIHFAKKYHILPISMDDSEMMLAISDPTNLAPLDDLALLFSKPIQPILAQPDNIMNEINRLYDLASGTAASMVEGLDDEMMDILATELEEPKDLLDESGEAPIIRLVNSLLFQAVKERASDIHIEPFERDVSARFRIDGVLYDIVKAPKRFQSSIISRVKIMAGLNIAEKRLPQDGRIRIKLAGKDIDIRVSVIPTSHGERIVMRLLDKTNVLLTLDQIGLSGDKLVQIRRLIHASHGIVLETGPTGSGKTTTLYAALSEINSPEKNIITTEDPVEYQIDGIGQIQVNTKIDLTFARGLRSILRQDPDVIMVGEIRDLETAEIAIQASLTGHLVFSTLHTNDAPGAITRLIDMGIEPFLVSSSVIAIVAQRLLRVLCGACREHYEPTDEELKEIGLNRDELADGRLYRSSGCEACLNTGFSGRTGIYELLMMDEEIQNLVMKNVDSSTIKRAAISRGMLTLRQDGAQKVLTGETSIREVLRVTQEESFYISE
ncbi:type II secretion system ATPase GspE [Thermodesulfobacteriota bacterium]